MQGWWECVRCAGMVGVCEVCRDGGSEVAGMVGV